MANGFFVAKKGLNLGSQDSDPAGGSEGDFYINSVSNLVRVYIQGGWRAAVTADQTQTLTNKTLSGATNTITGVVAANVVVTPSGNLIANDVQEALVELQTDVDTRATQAALTAHLDDATDAHDASTISVSAISGVVATDVQGALAELQADVDTRALDTDFDAHTASTTAHGATGAVVGTTNTQTLTNKLISGSTNTLTNIPADQLTGTADVDNGGTGVSSLTSGNVILGAGTSPVTFVAPGTAGNVLTSSGSSWVSSTAASAPSGPNELSNLGIKYEYQGSGDWDLSIVTQAGVDPSVGSPVKVGVRHPTLSTGTYNQRSLTALTRGTFGFAHSYGLQLDQYGFVYVYLVDSDGAGTMKVATCRLKLDEGKLYTTSDSGGGLGIGNNVLYSDAVYTSKPVVLVGRMYGQYQDDGLDSHFNPTELMAGREFEEDPIHLTVARSTSQTSITFATYVKVQFNSTTIDSHNCFDVTTNYRFTPPVAGVYEFSGALNFSGSAGTGEIAAALYLNGVRTRIAATSKGGTASVPYGVAFHFTLKLATTDYVELFAYQGVDSPNSILRGNTSDAHLTHLNITKV